MDFAALKQELSDRGYATLSDARLGLFVNQGRAELDNLRLWPYRLDEQTGAAPLVIADLGTIEEVADTGQPQSPALDYRDRRTLRDEYGDLTVPGVPCFFYVDNGTVRTFPVGGSLAVRYYKRTPQLVEDDDAPLAPVDYHMLYGDFAVRWAAKDGEQPDGLSADIQRQLQAMGNDLFMEQIAGSDEVPVEGYSLDW